MTGAYEVALEHICLQRLTQADSSKWSHITRCFTIFLTVHVSTIPAVSMSLSK